MLIEFKVGNFRSFKDIVTLSMVASADKEHLNTHTFEVNDKLRLLRSSVVYGANASGKSNLFTAMAFMRNFLFSNLSSQSTEKIPVDKFRLSTAAEKLPSTFEMTFMIDKTRYRYGFQVDEEKIQNEWLFSMESSREATLFVRENDKIKLGPSFKEGRELFSKTRSNALFLPVVDQFNGEIAKKIMKWFSNLDIISGNMKENYEGFSVSKLRDQEYREFIYRFLNTADLGIKEIKADERDFDEKAFPPDMPKRLKKMFAKEKIIEIKTYHQKYDDNNLPIDDEEFSFDESESAGTKALFGLSAPIYHTLKHNKILVVDEFTSQLHPLLTRFIIDTFHNYGLYEENSVRAKSQLIFACHDIDILSNEFFRRDQIWFTEKNKFEASDLFSLADYKVRKDASFDKDYMIGKYGAVPFLGNIESLFSFK